MLSREGRGLDRRVIFKFAHELFEGHDVSHVLRSRIRILRVLGGSAL